MILDLQTIGIAMETSGLEKGTAALKNAGQAAEAMADKFQDAEGRWRDASGRFVSALERVALGLKNTNESTNGFSGGSDKARAATEKLTNGVNDQIKKLQDQLSTFGMSTRQAELYRASTDGATKAQLDQIAALQKQTASLERAGEMGQRAGELIKAGALLAAGAAVAAAVAFEKLIGNVAKYQDLAEQTGGSAAGLASLRTAADVGGTSVEALSMAANRLEKNLARVNDESKGAGKALAAVGITLDDFKKLTADQKLRALGKALNGYADDGAKIAVIQDIMGRGAANLLPALKELGAETEKNNGLTNEQIRLADDYKDAQARARSELSQMVELIAVRALPSFTDFVGISKDLITEMFNIGTGANDLAKNTSITKWADRVVDSFAFIIDAGLSVRSIFGIIGSQAAGIAAKATARERGDTPEQTIARRKAISEGVKDDISAYMNDTSKWRDAIAGRRAVRESEKTRVQDPDFARELRRANRATEKPSADYSAVRDKKAGKAKVDPEIKAAYDAALNALKIYADQEKFLNSERIKDIDAINKRGVMNEYEYHEKKHKAAMDGLAKQKETIEKEKALLEASKLPQKDKVKAMAGFQKALQDINQAQTASNAELVRQEEATAAKVNAVLDKRLADAEASTKKLVDEQTAIRKEREEFGLTEKQLQDLTLARAEEMAIALERQAVTRDSIDLTGAESEELRKQAALIRSNAKDRADSAGIADLAKQSKQYTDDFRDWLTGSLRDGFSAGGGFFKSLWNSIKNAFKTTALKLIVNAVVGGVGGGGSMLANAAQSIMGGGGVAGAGSSMLSSLTGSATALYSAASYFASGVSGTFVGAAAGGGATLAGAATGIGAAAGTGVAGIASTVGAALTAIGPVGWAALAAIAVVGFASGRGETRSGATYDTDANGMARRQQGPSGGEINGGDARKAFDAAQTAIKDTLAAVGSKAVLTGFTAGLESSKNGKGFEFAGGMINGVGFGESGGRDGRQFGMKSQDAETAFKGYILQLKQSTIEALQAATDLPKSISDKLAGVNASSLTGEAVDKIMGEIQTVVASVGAFQAAVSALPFANLKDLAFDAAAGLIAAAGGLQSLESNLATFYQNFYSEEDQRASKILQINAATAGSGLDAATATRESFKALVNGQDLTTEAGRNTYASLLSVAGALSGLIPPLAAVETVVETISEVMRGLNKERGGLQADVLDAQGNTAGGTALRRAQLFEGDPATTADNYNAAEIAAYDHNEALRQEIIVLNKATAAADALAASLLNFASDRENLKADLLDAQGDKGGAFKARRDIAITGFDEAQIKAYDFNVALRATITTLNDATTAALALKATNKGLTDQLDVLTGTETDRSIALRDAGDESTRSILKLIHAQTDKNAADAKAIAIADALVATNKGLNDQLAILNGTETDRSLALRDATDDTTKSLLKQIHVQQDLKTAAEALAQSLSNFASERGSLEADLLDAKGNKGGASDARRAIAIKGFTEAEIAAYDFNVALRKTITEFNEATATAASTAAALAAAAETLASTNRGLTDQLAVLKGTETERSLALRDATDGTTKALLNQIYAQQDLKLASEKATEAQREAAAAALSAATAGAGDGFSGLQRAVSAQKEAAAAIYKAQNSALETSSNNAKTALDGVAKSLGNLRDLSQSLRSSLNSNRISGSDGAYRSDAQSQISTALNRARSGGGLPVNGELENALSTISKPSEELFSSFVDYARDFYKTSNDIASLATLTDTQLSADEMARRVLENQLETLNMQSELLKTGFDAQVSASDAILTNAQLQLDAANGINISVLSVGAALVAFNESILRLTGERANQNMPTALLGSAVETGISRTFNAPEIRSMLQSGGANNSELVAEMRALRAEVQGLRAEAAATAGHTAKTARVMERITPDGDALQTRAIA